jgi:hypothetical protein
MVVLALAALSLPASAQDPVRLFVPVPVTKPAPTPDRAPAPASIRGTLSEDAAPAAPWQPVSQAAAEPDRPWQPVPSAPSR